MKASVQKYQLIFKRPAGTSRGVLRQKETFIIKLTDKEQVGYGEAALFRGLSADDVPDYETKLQWLMQNINLPETEILSRIKDYSSLIFGWEQAHLSLQSSPNYLLFPTDFTQGKKAIPINGLVWMGEKNFMLQQINEKIKQGFKVIKLKIGAIDFKEELSLLRYIRQNFSEKDIEIRVDANGAFSPEEALEKLKRLSDFQIHSIEQPIRQGQWEQMAKLCETSPLPIALDEELIGYAFDYEKEKFLQRIKPQYIILKPALHGGFIGTKTWINAAEKQDIKWWITSALESNMGLNAIAQFTEDLQVNIPQGLGTGGLFINNFKSPLYIQHGALYYDPEKALEIPL